MAAALRRHGLDVTTTAEAQLLGASDHEQLSFARAAGRVFVTHDADFLRLHQEAVPHTGIAYCRPASRTLGELLRRLLMLHSWATASEMEGRVEFL